MLLEPADPSGPSGREKSAMRAVLKLIKHRRHSYEQHPFIRFLRDESIDAERRLSYAPFASFFVLSFAELNRNILCEDESSGPQQAIVNRHTEEDSTHWTWFLHDMKILGYDIECRVSEVLCFLWSDLGRCTREMSQYAISVSRAADAQMRLVIIEAMEAMGNVWLEATIEAARQHPKHQRLIYFGGHHLERETGHAIGSSIDEIRDISLPPQTQAEARNIVHGLFDHMEAFNAELLQRVDRIRGANATNFLEC